MITIDNFASEQRFGDFAKTFGEGSREAETKITAAVREAVPGLEDLLLRIRAMERELGVAYWICRIRARTA